MRSLGALVFVLLAAGPVHAQAPPSSDEADASEGVPPTAVEDAALDGLDSPEMTSAQAYALGVQMFEAERFAEAEQAWLRAYELDPQPKLLIAIAETRARRDDEPGTVEMLERYLAESPEAPDRVSVEAQIATLLQTPATLVVRSAEEGNPILVDGVPVARTTPSEIEIEPGSHTVVVVGDGRQVGEQTVQVGYGERRELMFLSSTPSEIILEESPSDDAFAAEQTTARRAVWALTGIAGASLITGTALGVTALRQEDRYRDNPTLEAADKGDRFALFADLSFGLAAVTAITALTVFLTTKNKGKRRDRASARLQFDSTGAGGAATFRF